MGANEDDYDGVPYADLVFTHIDWSGVGEHDPSRRAERKGNSEANVLTEWADEACQDPFRVAMSARSRDGIGLKVVGWSPGAGFVVTVISRPVGTVEDGRGRSMAGCNRLESKKSEIRAYEEDDE